MRREDLSPGAQAVLAAPEGTPFEEMSAADARAAFDAAWPLTQLDMPGTPTEIDLPVPALSWGEGDRTILYLHGGGWVVGSPASHGAICQRLAATCGARVICPDYRLAPEHPFPAAVDDTLACLAALPAADPRRIIVAGDSAGGNLAAVAALSGGAAAQLLYYPNTSVDQRHDSYRRFATGFGLTADTMRWFRDQYRPDPADWRASPLLAASHGPPAHIVLAGADILHDEGRDYADRLIAAGVDVQLDTFPDRIHGFLSMCRYDPAGAEAIAASARFLDARGI